MDAHLSGPRHDPRPHHRVWLLRHGRLAAPGRVVPCSRTRRYKGRTPFAADRLHFGVVAPRIVPAFVCPRCNAAFRLESFLEAVSGYSTATNSGNSFCPECHEALEFRVARGTLELGYTYWAGSLHFEAVSSLRVAGLRLASTEGSLVATFKGTRFPFSPPRPPAGR